jgi:hypothetical protein
MSGKRQGTWYWRTDYLGYALACAVAWGVIWILLVSFASKNTEHTMSYVFLGWVIGWASAAIAGLIYPPPRRTLSTKLRRHQATGT